jgi:acylphosphatase
MRLWPPKRESLRFTVTGKVQGVGFRSYVLTIARELDVSGEVWNDKSGGVSGIAVGLPDELATFEEKLKRGPGTVVKVSVDKIYDALPYMQFSITRSR